jgi:3-phenylpropionate/trans-cinnamate dioxygenase ferredoxin component
MAERIDVCPITELPPGAMRVVEWEDLEIAVVNCAGALYAIEDRCSHDDGPLCEGPVDWSDHTVICPRHGSKFEIKTGRVLNPPAYAPVETFAVRVDDAGMIKVDITDD